MAGQQHLDRLSAIDAGFLAQEKPNTHMHIGGARAVRGRAAGARRVPRAHPSRACTSSRATGRSSRRRRWRPAARCGSTTRPSTSPTTCATPRCPRRASEDALLDLAARVFSQRLDRSKPLWELWLVEGLADGGFALVSKTHHALVDGVSGVDLSTVLFDLTPEAPAPTSRRAVGAAARADVRRARRARADRRGARGGRGRHRRARRGLAPGRDARPRARGRHRHRRGRLDRAQRTRPTPRSTCRPARTGGSRSCARASTSSSSSSPRSAPRSTTSCSRW